jgi:hypothetical protein
MSLEEQQIVYEIVQAFADMERSLLAGGVFLAALVVQMIMIIAINTVHDSKRNNPLR